MTLYAENQPARQSRRTTPTIERNPPKPVDRKPESSPIAERAAFVESKPEASANYSEAARPFYEKGLALQASGQYAEAAEAFNQAVRVNPNDANAYAKTCDVIFRVAETQRSGCLSTKWHSKRMAAHSVRRLTTCGDNPILRLRRVQDALEAFKQARDIVRADAIDPERKRDGLSVT